MSGSTGTEELLAALTALRDTAEAVRLPLETPSAAAARTEVRRLVDQLDDYVLPRLRRLDAPLLVVVGGSTGAGKSTLVNSLVGTEVTRSGVLRPTTRAPVLVHHPADADAFVTDRVLPRLRRVTREGDAAGADDGAGGRADGSGASSLRLVAVEAVPRGLALLDAPDIDSVVVGNRELAAQLLAAADLWVFLTTAARYADAVPWAALRGAAERSVVVAVVLDRVPPDALDAVREHLAAMLAEEGLSAAPLFVVPEASGLEGGLLPAGAVEPLRSWLVGLAQDAQARAEVVRATLAGTVRGYHDRLDALVAAADEQERAAARLRATVVSTYDAAGDAVESGVRSGSVLRGEVLARWQEVVGTGDLLGGLQRRVGRWRDVATARLLGRAAPIEQVTEALESGVEALVLAEADRAAEAVAAGWRASAAGRTLLEQVPGRPDSSSPQLRDHTVRLVRDWEAAVLDLVRREGAGRRRTAQVLAYGVNGTALVVMLGVFAAVGPLTGGEVVVAGGASALSQKVLEAVLGDQVVRSLAERARADLRDRVDRLLAEEGRRFTAVLDAEGPGEVGAEQLALAARRVDDALRAGEVL